MWHHTKQGDRYVTVVIDLTPVRDRSGLECVVFLGLGEFFFP